MASDKKNNFILYKDFKSTIDLLTDEQAGKLIKAVFSYVNGRVEPNFTDGAITIAFSILKTQLERDLVKYKTIVERNQTNGLKGGRPKNNPNEKDKPKKPSGLNGNPKEPKKADSDSVSDSVSERDIKDKPNSVAKINDDFNLATKHIVEYLNKKTGKSFKHNTPATRDLIKARFNQGFQIEDFEYVINVKCDEWLKDDTKEMYLRPQTLFGNKFESYRNQKTSTKKQIDDWYAQEYKRTGKLL